MSRPEKSARPCVSVPAALLTVYHAAGSRVPPLSALLQEAMAAALRAVGVRPPRPPRSTRTAAATAARWGREPDAARPLVKLRQRRLRPKAASKKSTRDPSRGT